MSFMIKFICIIFLSIIGFKINAQDLILKKDGNQINCEIIKIDDLIIQYKTNRNSSSENQFIDRKEVLSYTLSNFKKSLPDSLSTSLNQEKELPFIHIKIDGGISLPVSSFGRSSSVARSYGDAGLGNNFKITTAFMATSFFGFDISVNSINNKYVWPNPDVKEQLDITNEKPYKNLFVGAGLFFTFPIIPSEKLSIDAAFNFGIVKARIPEFEAHSTSYITETTQTIKYQSAPKFEKAGEASLGFRYKLKNDFSINFSCDYFLADVFYNNIFITQRYTENGKVYFENYLSSYSKEIKILNFNLGLTYSIK